MEPIYRKKFNIGTADADCFGRLKPSALLAMMQEAAGWQCHELDLGWDTLARQGLFWAVTRHHVQVTRLPQVETAVQIETWPGITSRVAYPRSTIGYDEEGNELFRAMSLWVLMDLNSRSLVLPGKSGVIVDGTVRGGELAVPGSLAPVSLSSSAQRQVVYSELDRNGHMSNTRYLDWTADLLPSQFHREHPIRDFTVCYLNEAREGEQVDLHYELSPEGQLRVEADQAGSSHRIFAVRASFA